MVGRVRRTVNVEDCEACLWKCDCGRYGFEGFA